MLFDNNERIGKVEPREPSTQLAVCKCTFIYTGYKK